MFLHLARELPISFAVIWDPRQISIRQVRRYHAPIAELGCAGQCYSMLWKPKHELAPTVIKRINVKKGSSSINDMPDQWQPASPESFKSLASRMMLPYEPSTSHPHRRHHQGRWALWLRRAGSISRARSKGH